MPLRSTALRADLTLNGTAAPLAGALNGTGLRLESPSGPIMLDSLQASFDASGATSTAFTARLRGLAVPGAQALGSGWRKPRHRPCCMAAWAISAR
ncbi:hypothetical protein ACFQU7_19005 [Pseudoroseomonas wenyumeiae]